MPLLEAGQRRIFFAHIPKTGGTSVEAYMATKGRLSMTSPDERPAPGEPVTAQHYHRDLYLPKLADTPVDAFFAILRDPVDRMVSEYRFRLGKNGLAPVSRWIDAQTDSAPSEGRFDVTRGAGGRPNVTPTAHAWARDFYRAACAVLAGVADGDGPRA